MSPVLGARLREERVRSGRNQADFAKLAGVSRNSQTEYETGKTAPNTDYLERLADHGVDATYILTGVRQELAVEGWAAELLNLAARLAEPERDALLLITRRMVDHTRA